LLKVHESAFLPVQQQSVLQTHNVKYSALLYLQQHSIQKWKPQTREHFQYVSAQDRVWIYGGRGTGMLNDLSSFQQSCKTKHDQDFYKFEWNRHEASVPREYTQMHYWKQSLYIACGAVKGFKKVMLQNDL